MSSRIATSNGVARLRKDEGALSLFSGMGGLDLGAHLAGLRVSAAVDADGEALRCLNQALSVPTIEGFTQEIDPWEVVSRAGLSDDGSAILIGGPPCTAFSHAGFWLDHKRDGTDAQVERIDDYWSYVRLLRPRAFLLENVPGLTFRNHREVLDAFERRARRHGYSVTSAVLNASDYGVPQARRRLFVIGVRGKRGFKFPDPLFADQPRTAGWALGDLSSGVNPPESDETLRGKYAHLLAKVPTGDNYLFFTKERGHPKPIFGWRRRYWSFLLKLHPDLPSPTIAATRVTNNGPFHWDNRRLRLRELARLQGFPDTYPLADEKHARRHLGNAVPPLLAAQLIWQLRVFLGDCSSSRSPAALQTALSPTATASEVSGAIGSVIRADRNGALPRLASSKAQRINHSVQRRRATSP